MGIDLSTCCGRNTDSSDSILRGEYNQRTMDEKKQSPEAEDDDDSKIEEFQASKRAIAAAHFFGTILQKYFNEKCNQCPYMTDDDESMAKIILSNIYVFGGALRDVVMNYPINDVDIMIDLHSLTKYEEEHLLKYHTNSKGKETCLIYRHYMRKFNGEHSEKDLEEMMNDKEGPKIVKANFILNGRFLSWIITKNNDLQKVIKFKKIEIGAIEVIVYHFEFIESFIYNDIDLKGIGIDLQDLSHKNEDELLYDSFYQRIEHEIFEEWKEYEEEQEMIEFKVPQYPDDLLNITKQSDLTINSMVLSLNKILNEILTVKKWREICYDPFPEQVEGKKDAMNKLLKVYNDKMVGIDPGRHIYRIVKLFVKYENIKIDENLITVHKQLYDTYFTNKILMEKDKENINNSVKRGSDFIIYYFVEYKIKNKDIAMSKRFKCLEILGFNQRFKKILNENNEYKQKLKTKINQIKDDKLKKQFIIQMKKYQYNIF